jgi:hypothetical protein
MPWNRWPLSDRVLVNLVDGSAIDGLLIDKRGPLIVLVDAVLMTPDSEPSRMDGRIFIERDRVLFMQATQPKGG